MRDEGNRVLDSIAESAAAARRGGCPLHISHCKVAGRRNHGRAGEFLAAVRAARADGADVTGDMYPYTTGETFLAVLLPSGIQEGGQERMLARLSDPAERAFWHPSVRPSGVPYVVLAGHVVIDDGDFTGERHGRVLRAGRAEHGDPDRKAA
jgi:N-acyl-D-amino-acid deacylase